VPARLREICGISVAKAPKVRGANMKVCMMEKVTSQITHAREAAQERAH
jgi:hypothetical protein